MAASNHSEAWVRKHIREHLSDLFPRSYVESNSPGPWGATGRPDLELCIYTLAEATTTRYGIYAGLELKREDYGDTPWRGLTEEQEIKLTQIAKSDGLALLANTAPYMSPHFHRWQLAVWVYNYRLAGWQAATITGFDHSTMLLMEGQPIPA